MIDLRLSNSEMKQWRRDKRHWYLSTYLAYGSAREDEAGSTLGIGNAVHDALAVYYADGSDPVAFYEQRIAAKIEEYPTEENAWRKEADLVTRMLSGYLEWLEETGVDGDLEIEGSEQMVEVPLVSGITLLSKLDAPVYRRRDGARLALEHKTVGDLDTPLVILKADTQLLTEHLARFLLLMDQGATAEEAYDACHGVLYNMLKKVKRTAAAKPPFYGREDVTHNIHELRNHWKHCVAIGREILAARETLDAGGDHHKVCPPNPTRDSSWDNPFFKIYAMMDDGSDWMEAVENLFVKRDPLARYAGAEALLS